MTSEEERVIERLRSPHPTIARDALRSVARWKSLHRRGRRPDTSRTFEQAFIQELVRMAAGGPPWDAELINAVVERPCRELEEHFARFFEADPERILRVAPAWISHPHARDAGRRAARALRESSNPWTAYHAALCGARLGDGDQRTYEIIADAVQKPGPSGIWAELEEVLEPEEIARLNQTLVARGLPPFEPSPLHPSHPRARAQRK